VADGRQVVTPAASDDDPRAARAGYARALVVWVLVLGALYAFQELFR
jgi:hypothetical protein